MVLVFRSDRAPAVIRRVTTARVKVPHLFGVAQLCGIRDPFFQIDARIPCRLVRWLLGPLWFVIRPWL